MTVRVPINSATLQWGREVVHMDRDELARAAGVSAARIAEFEAGTNAPTFNQLTKLANKLDRTPAFFLAPPPDVLDVPEAVDFRGRAQDEPSPALAREMRRAELYRQTLLDLERPERPRLAAKRIAFSNAAVRAKQLRESLGLTEDFIPPENQDTRVLGFWRGLLEEHGYLVFQATRIPRDTFRGLSIHHARLPIILLNGADSNNGKVFTLFHEVAHLANRTSGLCVLDENMNEEAVANSFAANFLMPERRVRALIPALEGSPYDRAEGVSTKFRVSVLAAAIRLRSLGAIDEKELAEVRKESDRMWRIARETQKKQSGGPPAWRVKYRDLSPEYVGAVSRALDDQRVDWLDASYMLNARVPMVEQIIDEYRRTGGGE